MMRLDVEHGARGQLAIARGTGPSGVARWPRSVLLAVLVAILAFAPVAGAHGPARPAVPAPKDALGFVPGDDRKLADWATVVRYFEQLASTSDRVRLATIGLTTLGRPMIVATVSSPANLARLDRIKEVQRRLADPRTIATEAEARALESEAVAVVLVTFGIHSNEVGATLASTVIAHRLATDDGATTREILDRSVVLLVPSLNPDGVDIVKAWYDASIGTPWEGEQPDELYHHFVGHDNNRDWYAFTQVETRNVVDSVHNVWHPHVVNDVHQMGATGARLFVPPYLDPIEPNIPPEIVAGGNMIGQAVVQHLTNAGMRGVVSDAIFDAWTPARAYSHYHGGIRILTETASAKIATPIVVPPEQLRGGRGYEATTSSGNYPAPWPGGEWRLRDIVDYMTASTYAILLTSARQRDALVAGFARIGREAVTHRAGEPVAFLVPPEPALLEGEKGSQASRRVFAEARATLLDTLARGGVEVRIASSPFVVAGTTHPAGTAVVEYDQPYGAFAKTLLEKQTYPDLRQFDGGPPIPPYDVTAHTLSLLTGFEAVRVDGEFAKPQGTLWKVSDLGAGVAVQTAEVKSNVAGPSRNPPLQSSGRSRVGLYRGATAPMDEGWTRWCLSRFGVAWTRVGDARIRAGDLRKDFDTIVVPDMSATELSAGRAKDSAPEALTGGLGRDGSDALAKFADEGGTVICLNGAANWAIDALDLPVRNVLADVPHTTFYCPGAIVGLDVVDFKHRIVSGVFPRTIAWFEDGPGLELISDKGVRVVARFAEADRLRVSGWLLGPEKLAGRPAIVEVDRGRGHVVLFAFRPQYRGQSLATMPLLFNAIGDQTER